MKLARFIVLFALQFSLLRAQLPSSQHVNWDQMDFVYRDQSGTIQRIIRTSTGIFKNDILNVNGLTQAPQAFDDPTPSFEYLVLDNSVPDHFQTIFEYVYPDINGTLQKIYWRDFDLHWVNETLNNGGKTNAPPAASAAVRWSTANYVYRDIYGNIQNIIRDSGNINTTYSSLQLNNGGATNAPIAVGRPAPMTGYVKPYNYNISDIVYRDANDNIQHIYNALGQWHSEKLNNGGVTTAPPAAGDPSSMNCTVQPNSWFILDYVYRDYSGNIQHIYWTNGVWRNEVLNNGHMTNAPSAAGNPTSANTTLNKIGFILDYAYRDFNGILHHIYWLNYQWKHDILNNGYDTNAPLAAGDPSSYVDSDGLHYVYLDINGNTQHIYWYNKIWYSEQLNNGGKTNAPVGVGKVSLTRQGQQWILP